MEATSRVALPSLLTLGERFDLIYVDGSHEGLDPLMDLAFGLELLRDDGIIVIDDVYWDDIDPLRRILDRRLQPIVRDSKLAAYRRR